MKSREEGKKERKKERSLEYETKTEGSVTMRIDRWCENVNVT